MTRDPSKLSDLLNVGRRELRQELQQTRESFSDAQLAKLFVRRLYVVADQIAALNPDALYKVAVRALQRELWDLADEIEERLGR
jgi:hypothetical protein